MKEVQTQKEALIESLKLRTEDNKKAALEILDLMKFDLERGDFIGAVYKIGEYERYFRRLELHQAA